MWITILIINALAIIANFCPEKMKRHNWFFIGVNSVSAILSFVKICEG